MLVGFSITGYAKTKVEYFFFPKSFVFYCYLKHNSGNSYCFSYAGDQAVRALVESLITNKRYAI